MPNKRSAGSFCSMVVATVSGTSKSVESLDVSALGDGAECYCVANQAVYRYNSSSAQPNLAGADTFVVPLAGGGCWFKQNAQGDYSTLVQLTSTGYSNFVISTGNWQALPSGAGFYANINSNPFFSVDTTTGIMTYNGPSGKDFLIQAQMVIGSSSPVGSTIELDTTVNGALLGTGTQGPQLMAYTQETVSQLMQLTQGFRFKPNHGDTIQHVLHASGTAAGQTVNRYQVSILNVG